MVYAINVFSISYIGLPTVVTLRAKKYFIFVFSYWLVVREYIKTWRSLLLVLLLWERNEVDTSNLALGLGKLLNMVLIIIKNKITIFQWIEFERKCIKPAKAHD